MAVANTDKKDRIFQTSNHNHFRCVRLYSTIHRVIGCAGHTEIDLGAEHTAQTIYQLEILDHSAEAVAADLGVERVHNDLDVVASQRCVQLVVLETLQRHDGRDLSFCHELSTEVEECAEVCVWKIRCLVRVWLFVCCFRNVARRWACCHQGVSGKRHVFVVGFCDRPSTEVVRMFAAGTFESVGMYSLDSIFAIGL